MRAELIPSRVVHLPSLLRVVESYASWLKCRCSQDRQAEREGLSNRIDPSLSLTLHACLVLLNSIVVALCISRLPMVDKD